MPHGCEACPMLVTRVLGLTYGACAENTAPMEVEAFVVNVRNAVHADDAGILNPLIKRQQAGLVAQRIFSSPAVKVHPAVPYPVAYHITRYVCFVTLMHGTPRADANT